MVSECPICGIEIEEATVECPICGEEFIEEKERNEGINELTKISDIDEERARKLYENGMREYDDLLEKGIAVLIDIDGIGIDTALDILDEARELREEKEKKENEEGVEIITSDLEELTTFPDEEEVEEGQILEDLFKDVEESTESEKSEVAEAKEKVEEEKETEEGIVEGLWKNIDYTEDFLKNKKGEEEQIEREHIKKERDLESKHLHKEMSALTIERTSLYNNIPEAIPVIVALFIPLLFLIYVGLEFVIALLAYPSVYPARSIYYLTPSPLLQPSWISSLTLSLLVTVGLFLPTWKGYDFDSTFSLKLNKYMISISAAFSVIISVSLVMHIYSNYPDPVGLLAFVLLFLSLFLLVTQLDILWKENNEFPKTGIRKLCPGCGEKMLLVTENCPRCGLDVAVPDEDFIHEKAKGIDRRNYSRSKSRSKQKKKKEDKSDEEKESAHEEISEDKEEYGLDEEPNLVEEKLEEENEEETTEDEEIEEKSGKELDDEPTLVEEKLDEEEETVLKEEEMV